MTEDACQMEWKRLCDLISNLNTGGFMWLFRIAWLLVSPSPYKLACWKRHACQSDLDWLTSWAFHQTLLPFCRFQPLSIHVPE
jgi:hypothetical protein